jgi:hypothetical protein
MSEQENELNDIYMNCPKEPTTEELDAAKNEDLENSDELDSSTATAKDTEKPAEKNESQEKETDEEKQPSEADRIEKTLKDTAESDPAFKGILNDLQSERSKRQVAEKQIAELSERLSRIESAKSVRQWNEREKPTTEEAIAEKYGLDEDDVLTIGQYRELRNNQKERYEFESHVQNEAQSAQRQKHEAIAQAEHQFVSSLDPAMVKNGLSVEDVVNKENTLNLTGSDWKKFYDLPVGSVERAQFIYDTIIERTPDLKARKNSLANTQIPEKKIKEPKPASLPKGGNSSAKIAVEAAEEESERFHDLVNMSEEQLDAMLKDAALNAGG